MSEFYLKDNQFIKRRDWNKIVKSICSDFNELEASYQNAKQKTKLAFTESIYKRANNIDNYGISFSGGIDSTLIAHLSQKLNKNFTCYTVGLENSSDLLIAKQISDTYNFNLKFKVFSLAEIEDIIKQILRILKKPDINTICRSIILFGVISLAEKDNINKIFTGIGSEEIFAGFSHKNDNLDENHKKYHKECLKSLEDLWKDELSSDVKISDVLNISLATPYLDLNLMKTAMNIHPTFKVDKLREKIILREIADDWGIKKEFAWHKKDSPESGSGIIFGLQKLTKKQGFDKVIDYLQSLK